MPRVDRIKDKKIRVTKHDREMMTKIFGSLKERKKRDEQRMELAMFYAALGLVTDIIKREGLEGWSKPIAYRIADLALALNVAIKS